MSTPRPGGLPSQVHEDVSAITPLTLSETAEQPTPTASPKQLTICVGQEPTSLFWYDATSAAQPILAAIYDGPFDYLNFNNRAVILEKEPAQKDGDVFVEPVQVLPGEWIYDATGERVVLTAGVLYRPAGCMQAECFTTYEGAEPVLLDQLTVRFRLKPGLTWSDGAPLTADDSLFSYQVAQSLQPPAWQGLLQATYTYRAVDDLTVEWRGAPGFSGGSYAEKFFLPLPRHAWGVLDAQSLVSAEISSRTPLGWGAYRIESWQPGVQMVLGKNPYYWLAPQGLPYFDRLVVRFWDQKRFALQSLLTGECDWVDPSLISPERVAELQSLQSAGQAQGVVQSAVAWEQITWGVQRRDGAVSLLAQSEVRRALAYCLDRQTIAQRVSGDLAQVAQGFLPPGHPQALAPEQGLPYDPQAGKLLLEQAGWLDMDGDPQTPRRSQGVAGVPDETPLVLEYLVSPEAERQATAQQVQTDLAECGVGLNLVTLPLEDYLKPGPEGLVFGRQFQMAQFAWYAADETLCRLFLSREVPGPYPEFPKGWGGGNASGWSDPAYDEACYLALNALPDSDEKAQALIDVQSIFLEHLPALPLYWHYQLGAARLDLCMPESAQQSPELLWNVEYFYRAEQCAEP